MLLDKEEKEGGKTIPRGIVVIVLVITFFVFIFGLVFFCLTIVFGVSNASLRATCVKPTRNVIKVGVLTPGYQYDKYFAGLMNHAAMRARERMETIYGENTKIEFVVCTECTYDETQLPIEVQKLYEMGVKVFVGPLTSSQCDTLAQWSITNGPDALFISPSATANSLGQYPNVLRMGMSNFVRVNAYATKFAEFKDENLITNVFSIAKDDVSTVEFFSLLHENAESHMLNLEEILLYEDDSIEGKADALTYIEQLSQKIDGYSPNSTVIVMQSHDEITYFLEAADDFPIVLEYQWYIVGMAFNQDLLMSEDSVKNAAIVKLTSILFTGNGYTFHEDKQKYVNNIKTDMEADGISTDVGTLNPLIFQVHDAVLLVYDTARIYSMTMDELKKEYLIHESQHEFGFTGHLRMNDVNSYRYSGEYVFVTVTEVAGNTGWVVLSEFFSSPIVDTDPVTNLDKNITNYVINERDKGVAYLDKSFFDDLLYCDMTGGVIEGVDKYGTYRKVTFTEEEVTKLKQNGMFISLKNSKNFLKIDCKGVDTEEVTDFKMELVCPFSYSGNIPDCTFRFIDSENKELVEYQRVLPAVSLKDSIYECDLDEWLNHGLGFFANSITREFEDSRLGALKSLEIVVEQFKKTLK